MKIKTANIETVAHIPVLAELGILQRWIKRSATAQALAGLQVGAAKDVTGGNSHATVDAAMIRLGSLGLVLVFVVRFLLAEELRRSEGRDDCECSELVWKCH